MMAKHQKRYAMLIDLDKCIGCFSCQVACKAEYGLPFGTTRCRVETYCSGSFPRVGKTFLPRLCNHCENAPCIESCKDSALYKDPDGIVLIDRDRCTGCGVCHEKCPYNAIEENLATGGSEKCDFCHNRVAKGLIPVCVESCMGRAMLFGDMRDQKSEISAALKNSRAMAITPELGTNPSVFYISGGDVSNTPLKVHDMTAGRSTRRTALREDNAHSAPSAQMIYTSDAMCPSECGIIVSVVNGEAKKISGNPHSLINNGTLCAKGASGLQLTYSPHRIKTPLRRSGRRGEDRWEEITWEEAARHIAEKLIEIKQQHGPEAVFLDCGDVTDREAYYRLFHAFGTPNTCDHGSICDPNRRWGQGMMMGDERPLPDIQRPLVKRDSEGEVQLENQHDIKLLINIGANPLVATRFNYMSRCIPAARKENGCMYIVVDPAHTNSASRADMWLPIRPGTDAALLAAMLYCIIRDDSCSDASRKYIDHDFINKYTLGWEEFRDAFMAHTEKKDPSSGLTFFTPEWASEKTGISTDDIENLSRLFGTTKPAAIEIGMHGVSHHTNGDVASILMTALCLITGNIDRPGGLVFIDSVRPERGNKTAGKDLLERTTVRNINGREVTGKLSELHKDLYGDYPAAWKGVLADLPRKIREGIKIKHGPFSGHSYPVKAFISRAGNPAVTAGSTSDWTDALTSAENDAYRLELMVFIDTHITVTGKYADIVLPEAGFLERMGVSSVYTVSPEIALRDRVIKPLHQSKTPFDFMMTMAEALIKNGDPDISADDFSGRYINEEGFIDEILSEAPGIYNTGVPLPYPGLPEGCLITGTPDDPSALWGSRVIKKGRPLTVEWLRKNHGVAIWPASYFRYKKADGSSSGKYPKTRSKKFEFRFGYIEDINRRFGTDLPETFYWHENRWSSGDPQHKETRCSHPFHLISGRCHHSMTMTAVCPYLAETETECMKPLNNEFSYSMPQQGDSRGTYGLPGKDENVFRAGSVSIPVFAMNTSDAKDLRISTGDIITLESPLKKRIKGKAFLTDEIMPGTIKTAFGPGGQKASGTGFMAGASEYTPNINALHDPDNLTPLTGAPGFGDMIVTVIKETE